MKENIRFVLILAAVLLALRFGFRLIVRLVEALYSLVPIVVRFWYVSIPVVLLVIFLWTDDTRRRRKRREKDGLDPDKEVQADAKVEEPGDKHEPEDRE